MEALSWILKILGVLVLVVGWFGAVRSMFHESRGYGYMGFGVPVIAFVWALLHLDELKLQAILMGVGGLLLGGGIALAPK